MSLVFSICWGFGEEEENEERLLIVIGKGLPNGVNKTSEVVAVLFPFVEVGGYCLRCIFSRIDGGIVVIL